MKAKILIVDDSETVRQEVRAALAPAGFRIAEAIDGVDGVNQIQTDEIDCVVCDVNMPNKNGIELVEEIKQDPRFLDLPILMLTTEGSQDLIAQAKAAGAIGWVVKPFKQDLLLAAVRKLAQMSSV